jgi:cephalosporin hydroxylase
MSSSLKTLVPLSVRNRFRPRYQQLLRRLDPWVWRVRGLSLWPKPSAWRDLKEKTRNVGDIAQHYDTAVSVFSICQDRNEIRDFLEFMQSREPRVVGEIGMKYGGSTFLFLQVLSRIELMVVVDLQLNYPAAAKLKYLSSSHARMHCISGNSHSSETVARVSRCLAGRKFDLLFIDGDHSYEGVRKDFVSYQAMVKEGGAIAFHDIVPDDTTRYGRPQSDSCYSGEVYLLWQELKKRYPYFEFISDPNQNGLGIGVIINTSD